MKQGDYTLALSQFEHHDSGRENHLNEFDRAKRKPPFIKAIQKNTHLEPCRPDRYLCGRRLLFPRFRPIPNLT